MVAKVDGERKEKFDGGGHPTEALSYPFTQDIIFHGMRERGLNENAGGVPTCRRTRVATVLAIVVAHTTGNKQVWMCVCAGGRESNSGLAPLLPFDRTERPFFQTSTAAYYLSPSRSSLSTFFPLLSLFANALREPGMFSRIAEVAQTKRSENDAIKRKRKEITRMN